MAKKKNPRFGGKRDLKDTSGDGKITFADTYLGDLLGFDGTAGTKGKPGLLKSLGGARRMEDGVTTSKRPKARPKAVEKKATTTSGRGKPPTDAQIAERAKRINTPAATIKKTRKRLDDKDGRPVGIGGLDSRRDEPGAPFFVRGGRKKIVSSKRPTKKQIEERAGQQRPKKTFTPNEIKKNMKKITKKEWDDLTRKQKKDNGLPESLQDRVRLGNPPFKRAAATTSPKGNRPGSR